MYNFSIINKSVLPYSVTNDTVRLKLAYLENNKISYFPNASGNVYGNIGSGGAPQYMGTFVTDSFGYANFEYDTDNLPDKSINTCNVWCSGLSPYNNIRSSLAQVHFINNISTTISGLWCLVDNKFTGTDINNITTLGIPIDPPRGDIGDGTSLHFSVYDANLNGGSGVRGLVFRTAH